MPKAKPKTKVVKKIAPPKRVLSSEQEEMQSDLDTASALEAVALSRGGVIIIDSLTSDIVGLVSALAVKYKSASQLELVGLCADLKTKLDMLRVLCRAGNNKAFLLEQIGDALKE